MGRYKDVKYVVTRKSVWCKDDEKLRDRTIAVNNYRLAQRPQEPRNADGRYRQSSQLQVGRKSHQIQYLTIANIIGVLRYGRKGEVDSQRCAIHVDFAIHWPHIQYRAGETTSNSPIRVGQATQR